MFINRTSSSSAVCAITMTSLYALAHNFAVDVLRVVWAHVSRATSTVGDFGCCHDKDDNSVGATNWYVN